MTARLSRRNFLASAGIGVGGLVLNHAPYARAFDLLDQAQPGPKPIILQATTRTLEIDGKAATVMGLLQPNGTQGIESVYDTPFRVNLENKLTVPTGIHWHGLHPPNNQDGVPWVTEPPLRPNESVLYDFPLTPAGTHWMHSHYGLQEASLLAAPLIVHEKSDDALDEKQIVIMLGDYSFLPPEEIFAKLRADAKKAAMDASAMKMDAKPDANDWNYDAYLANDRTLNDPEVVKVEKSGRVRLRIINGSSGTNYFVDLGSLTGELFATDGMPIEPIRATRFPLAIAQRIDIRIQIPAEGGAFPILGLRELSREQTGIILATQGCHGFAAARAGGERYGAADARPGEDNGCAASAAAAVRPAVVCAHPRRQHGGVLVDDRWHRVQRERSAVGKSKCDGEARRARGGEAGQ